MIRVRFFASLREQIGSEFIELSLAGAGDLTTLWQRLEQQLSPAALVALRARGVKVAVNQELIEGNVQLRAGDEVAFLPPVTGG